jgi:HEAT repeat protein
VTVRGRRWCLWVMLLGACAPAEPPPAAEVAAKEPADPTKRLRHLLRARHPEDLPDRAALARIPDAEQALRTVATTDEDLIVRARAADLLGLFDTEENVAFLLALSGDTTAHGKLRAAAILGLGRTDLSRHASVAPALLTLARSGDPRLGPEAAAVLAAAPSAAAVVGELRRDEALAPAVRAALEGR